VEPDYLATTEGRQNHNRKKSMHGINKFVASTVVAGSEYLFEAKNLKKEFDDDQVQALRGVDF
jgi:hypothetical protein